MEKASAMELATQQIVLAKIYTNKKLRMQFFADPLTTGHELKLKPKDVDLLSGLSSKQVHLFARSLHRKRMNYICSLLPLTSLALEDQFNDLFFRYIESRNPNGSKWPLEDAIMFSEFLLTKACDDLKYSWVMDLLHYETASLKAASGKSRFLIRKFSCQVQLLAKNFHLNNEISKLLNRPCFAFWFRLSKRGPMLHKVFSLPSLMNFQSN